VVFSFNSATTVVSFQSDQYSPALSIYNWPLY